MGYWDDEYPQQVQREQAREAKWNLAAGGAMFAGGAVVALTSIFHAVEMDGGLIAFPYGLIVVGLALIWRGGSHLVTSPRPPVRPRDLTTADDGTTSEGKRSAGIQSIEMPSHVSIQMARQYKSDRPELTIRGQSILPQIRRGIAYVPLFLFSIFFYWIWIGIGLDWLLHGNVNGPPDRNLIITAVVLSTLFNVAYWLLLLRHLSKFILAVNDQTLTVIASRPYHFFLGRYCWNLANIQRIVFGKKLNIVERCVLQVDFDRGYSAVVRELKQGYLLVQTSEGERVQFQFLNKAFDENELVGFVWELVQRGLPVEIESNPNADD